MSLLKTGNEKCIKTINVKKKTNVEKYVHLLILIVVICVIHYPSHKCIKYSQLVARISFSKLADCVSYQQEQVKKEKLMTTALTTLIPVKQKHYSSFPP